MSYHETLGAIGWLAFALLAAWLATWLMPDEWYGELSKPGWNPPAKLYVPLWTVTYAFMGAAGWLVWKNGGMVGRAIPLGLFTVQLVLQVAWSWLLFGRHRMDQGADRYHRGMGAAAGNAGFVLGRGAAGRYSPDPFPGLGVVCGSPNRGRLAQKSLKGNLSCPSL